jgi:hypothetical protein
MSGQLSREPGIWMERQPRIATRVEQARHVGIVLQRLGWSVAVLGVIGVLAFSALWAAGDLDVEQGVSLILGTALAVILSGATSYGAGVNLGLGAERLDLAAAEAANPAAETPAAEIPAAETPAAEAPAAEPAAARDRS